MAKISLSHAAHWVAKDACVKGRGGVVKVKNGKIVVNGEQTGYWCWQVAARSDVGRGW